MKRSGTPKLYWADQVKFEFGYHSLFFFLSSLIGKTNPKGGVLVFCQQIFFIISCMVHQVKGCEKMLPMCDLLTGSDPWRWSQSSMVSDSKFPWAQSACHLWPHFLCLFMLRMILCLSRIQYFLRWLSFVFFYVCSSYGYFLFSTYCRHR